MTRCYWFSIRWIFFRKFNKISIHFFSFKTSHATFYTNGWKILNFLLHFATKIGILITSRAYKKKYYYEDLGLHFCWDVTPRKQLQRLLLWFFWSFYFSYTVCCIVTLTKRERSKSKKRQRSIIFTVSYSTFDEPREQLNRRSACKQS